MSDLDLLKCWVKLADAASTFFKLDFKSDAFDLPSCMRCEIPFNCWISCGHPSLLVNSPKVVTWWPSKQCMN